MILFIIMFLGIYVTIRLSSLDFEKRYKILRCQEMRRLQQVDGTRTMIMIEHISWTCAHWGCPLSPEQLARLEGMTLCRLGTIAKKLQGCMQYTTIRDCTDACAAVIREEIGT